MVGLAVVLGAGTAHAQEPPSEGLRSELQSYHHKIVYESHRDGNWELYLVNADGSNPVNLTRTPDVDEVYPKPSSDGSKIVFVADQGAGKDRVRDLYVMNADGSDRVKIADNAREPCWSPDGSAIAYLKGEFPTYNLQDFATKGLYIHDVKTGETRPHPNGKLEHLYTLNWAPGGDWFVATVHGGLGFSHAIVAIEADGDRVINLNLGGCRPNVRRDGKQVTWGHGDFCAGVADLDLTGPTPKATNIRDAVESKPPVETYHVTWSPDGKYLTFTTGPKATKKNLKGLLPEFPGVEAPGWNVGVADASARNRWVPITTDGESNKQPSWVVVREDASR
jgi:Tol biopolymer transport system component